MVFLQLSNVKRGKIELYETVMYVCKNNHNAVINTVIIYDNLQKCDIALTFLGLNYSCCQRL